MYNTVFRGSDTRDGAHHGDDAVDVNNREGRSWIHRKDVPLHDGSVIAPFIKPQKGGTGVCIFTMATRYLIRNLS